MAVTSGFFNAVNNDRAYDAEQMSRMFEGVLLDGVFPSIGNVLNVAELTGMTAKVESGRAWFDWSWLKNDSDIVVSFDSSHQTLPRIDVVALDFDWRESVRRNDIVVVRGTPASTPVAPTLISEDDHNQYPIAHVTIQPGATNITTGDITIKVGSSECPFSTGILQHVSIDNLLSQWEYEFTTWFNELVDVLDEEAAGNIMNVINEVRSNIPDRNLIYNGDMGSLIRSSGSEVIASDQSEFDGYFKNFPDCWRFYTTNNGDFRPLFDVDYVEPTPGNDYVSEVWGRVFAKTLNTGAINADAATYIEQRIPLSDVKNRIRKGDTNADQLTLSFDYICTVPGNYVVELIDTQNNVHAVGTYNNPTTDYLRRSASITFPADTINSWDWLDNYAYLKVRFWLSAGSNYTSGSAPTGWATVVDANSAVGQTNLATVTDGSWQIGWVQLEIGDTKTTFVEGPDTRRFIERTRAQAYVHVDVAGVGYCIADYHVDKLAGKSYFSKVECRTITPGDTNYTPFTSVGVAEWTDTPVSEPMKWGRTVLLELTDARFTPGGYWLVLYDMDILVDV